MSHAAASQAGRTPGPSAERVRVPLLAELLERDVRGRRRIWADLGASQAGLIARLTDSASRLIVSDLPAALLDGNANWHLPDSVLETSFWNESVDCFLCWDLLNYMRPDQLAELSQRIARLGGSDCRVHALIQYSGKTMTAIPGRYSLDDDLQLTVSTADGPMTQTPRYSPKALEKAMPQLQVERTMLLNNGMQEFVFGLR